MFRLGTSAAILYQKRECWKHEAILVLSLARLLNLPLLTLSIRQETSMLVGYFRQLGRAVSESEHRIVVVYIR